MPFKMVEKQMIAPGSRDAPKFRSDEPEKLRKFVRSMEDLWLEAGVVDDDAKKKKKSPRLANMLIRTVKRSGLLSNLLEKVTPGMSSRRSSLQIILKLLLLREAHQQGFDSCVLKQVESDLVTWLHYTRSEGPLWLR